MIALRFRDVLVAALISAAVAGCAAQPDRCLQVQDNDTRVMCEVQEDSIRQRQSEDAQRSLQQASETFQNNAAQTREIMNTPIVPGGGMVP
jgi:hypothetical protein